MNTAYVLWHWPRSSIAPEDYRAAQRAFHAALASEPVAGFAGSTSFGVSGFPWVNAGGDAYEDWYSLTDLAGLDALEELVASGRRDPAHANAASGAAGGCAAVYSPQLGTPLAAPAYSHWFNRPAGLSYRELLAMLEPQIKQGEQVLWKRRLVLGPMEFCVQSTGPMSLPAALGGVAGRYLENWHRHLPGRP